MNYQPVHYQGLSSATEHRNFFPRRKPGSVDVVPVAEGVYRANGRSNAGWVVTREGVVVIDSSFSADALVHAIRESSSLPVRFVVYTHGHADHTFTMQRFTEMASSDTQVVSHAFLPQRLRKNEFLAPSQDRLRDIQFREFKGPSRNPERKFPDIVYHGEYRFNLGDVQFSLFHGRGETDDATVVHVVDRGVVFTGDFLIGSWPNFGNPYKVPRYGREWYEMLERIRELDPAVLVPGHGYDSLTDKAEIRACLTDTIEGMRYVHDEVVRRLNMGQPLSQMVAEIHLPPALENSPYLAQIYSRVEFAVIAFHRGYMGWFEGEPSDIYPVPRQTVAHHLRELIGNDTTILTMAERLWSSGERGAAIEILQVLLRDDPEHQQGRKLRLRLMETLVAEDKCQMSRGAWEYFAEHDRA